MLILQTVRKMSKCHKSINKLYICSSAIDSAKYVHYTVISSRSEVFPAIKKHYLHIVANINIFYLEAVVHQITLKKKPQTSQASIQNKST